MNSDTESIKQMLLRSIRAAAAEKELILTQKPLSKAFLQEHFNRYVLIKYMLTEEECQTDDFHELTELSLAKSMKISKELVEEFDKARSCDGASSVMAKKVLLFMAIQKDFSILLPAERTATFKTMAELCDMVWEALVGGESKS